MRYVITRKQCKSEIDKNQNVCERCGRKLVPIKTVDNVGSPTYWSGCRHGNKYGHFTFGVSKETYDLAVKLVLEDSINFGIRHEDKEISYDYAFMEATRRACNMILDIEYMRNNKPRYTKKQLFNIYSPTKGEKEEAK